MDKGQVLQSNISQCLTHSVIPRPWSSSLVALRDSRFAARTLIRTSVDTADLEQGIDISTLTANALIRDLMRLGILHEVSGLQRNSMYEFERYLALFLS